MLLRPALDKRSEARQCARVRKIGNLNSVLLLTLAELLATLGDLLAILARLLGNVWRSRFTNSRRCQTSIHASG